MAFLGMRPHLARPLICFTVKGGLIDREQRSNYAEYTHFSYCRLTIMELTFVMSDYSIDGLADPDLSVYHGVKIPDHILFVAKKPLIFFIISDFISHEAVHLRVQIVTFLDSCVYLFPDSSPQQRKSSCQFLFQMCFLTYFLPLSFF